MKHNHSLCLIHWLPLVALCLLPLLTACSNDDEWSTRELPEDYHVLFKDGKSWRYKSQDCFYSDAIQGDTLINGKQFKKLYRTYEQAPAGDSTRYFAAVREASLRAFYVLANTKTEKLLFDFGAKVDERFRIGPLHGTYIVKIVGEVTSEPDGIKRIQWSLCPECGGAQITELRYWHWLDGIGNETDLLNESGNWQDSHLLQCYEDDRCIYESPYSE